MSYPLSDPLTDVQNVIKTVEGYADSGSAAIDQARRIGSDIGILPSGPATPPTMPNTTIPGLPGTVIVPSTPPIVPDMSQPDNTSSGPIIVEPMPPSDQSGFANRGPLQPGYVQPVPGTSRVKKLLVPAALFLGLFTLVRSKK